MGKLVTFWSPYQGMAKVTSSMCAIVGMLGIRYPEYEIAISHITPESIALEKRLDAGTDIEGKKEIYERAGVSALVLNGMQAVLTSEKIRRCAFPLIIKSLYLYPAYGAEYAKDIVFSLLTEYLKQEFSLVFLDMECGWKEHSIEYMKASDFVVIVLPQEPDCFEMKFLEHMKFLDEKNWMFLIGGYLGKSIFTAKHILKKAEGRWKEKFAGVVPMNTAFFDAMMQGKTLEFLLKNQLVRKNEENYEFMVQTQKTAEYIKRNIFVS